MISFSLYCNVIVEIPNVRFRIAYCASNDQKMNQNKCRKAYFQTLIMHKKLGIKK